MEKIFLDTGFIIALIRPSDENHLRAKEISNRIYSTFFLSDHIIDEVVTFLGKYKETETAYEVGKRLLNSDNVEIAFPAREELEIGLELFNKYKELSLCDALSVVFMKRHEVKKIISFDSDFDLIPGIERIH
ncbi:type II toxin-antitoxin system VapC family toxin [Candidatus Micrarchaeota archaeon]|nr:type II toxin-antitoxin system VapC family toxin [Candidatus Micrarchaeota archaeon]